MKVTSVSASIRYSKSLEPGEHKTAELTAEGSIEPDDDWHQAQQDLYASLTGQLRALWGGKKEWCRGTCPRRLYDGHTALP